MHETLRFHMDSMSIREVLEDTEILSKDDDSNGGSGTTYKLSKGAIVNMPSSLHHFNPRVHADPHTYRPTRFLAKELGGDGTSPGAGLRAFGGGASYCPGRIFADIQIVAFLAALLGRFDVRIAPDIPWTMPVSADFEVAAKTARAFIMLEPRAQ